MELLTKDEDNYCIVAIYKFYVENWPDKPKNMVELILIGTAVQKYFPPFNRKLFFARNVYERCACTRCSAKQSVEKLEK